MTHSGSVIVVADHLAAFVDAPDRRDNCPGDIDRGEGAAAVAQEAMANPFGVHVIPNDLALVVDVVGAGVQGTGDIDQGHLAPVPEVAARRERVVPGRERAVASDDLPAVVDSVGCRSQRAGDLDRDEAALVEEEAAKRVAHVEDCTDDLAAAVAPRQHGF